MDSVQEYKDRLEKDIQEAKDNLLRQAVHEENVDAIAYLLKQGADPNTCTKDGNTLLSHTIMLGKEQLMHLLLSVKNIDVNKTGGDNNLTPLTWAMYKHNEKVARLLLEKGADIHQKAFGSESALQIAGNPHYAGISETLRHLILTWEQEQLDRTASCQNNNNPDVTVI